MNLHPANADWTEFSFSTENLAKAKDYVARYPEGRQQSAVMPLLDLAQRQCGGWLPNVAVEYVADFLGMPKIRVLEVATFYSMYNQAPVGKSFVQLCRDHPVLATRLRCLTRHLPARNGAARLAGPAKTGCSRSLRSNASEHAVTRRWCKSTMTSMRTSHPRALPTYCVP